MLACVELEQGLPHGSVDFVVICELCQRQPVCPIVLLMSHEDLEIGFCLLVHALCLAIGLRVVGCGGSQLNSEEGGELAGEVGHEGRSLVTDNLLWKSMVMPDMFQEQAGNSGRVQGSDSGDSMDPFGQTIHNYEDGVVPLGVRELTNHVDRDNLLCLSASGNAGRELIEL